MRKAAGLALAVALTLTAAGQAWAETNLEGNSGLLAVPTAAVVRDGDVAFTYGRYYNDSLDPSRDFVARAYGATVGYLPGLEIAARFVDFPERPDSMGATNYADRSVSVKYQFFRNEDWSLAFGGLDIGGQSQRNEAVYGVVDYHGIPSLELSAGGGTEKFEGMFGGVRWTPIEWASVLGEYDTRQVNYGLEVRPHPGVTVKAGLVNEHLAYSASYTMSIDQRGQDTPCCPVTIERRTEEYPDACSQAAAVRDALVAESFENVLVGVGGDTLFVEYESRRFREQLDAIAVAAAVAAQRCGPEIKRLMLAPKLDDVPQLSLQADVDALLAFLATPGACPDGIWVTPYMPGGCLPETVFAAEGNKKPGGGEVQLRFSHAFEITRPDEPTFASRNGLGLEERMFLGRALSIRARQDWPFHNDINDKTDPINRDALLQYSDAWTPELFVLANGGWLRGERFGGQVEAGYYLKQGRFKLGGRYGWYTDESEGEEDPEDALALGELAYYEPRLDWEMTALGGQFLEGDQGIRVESTRRFGPTSLTFFAYDTDDSEPHGGFRFFVPLEWYSERRHDDWRAVGSPYFGFQYRTDSDPSGVVPLAGVDLATIRGQLRPEYVAAHLDDFRRAVVLYLGGC